MMNSKAVASLLLFLLVGCCGCQEAKSQGGTALIQNPGFEQGSPGSFPSGWTQEGHLESLGRASVERRPDASGQALRLAPNNRNSDPNRPFGVAQVLKIADLPGATLQLSAALMGVDGATPIVLALPMSRDMKPLSVLDLSVRPGKGFQSATREINTGNAEYLVIACVVSGEGGEAWFDDLSLTLPGKLAPAAASSSPTSLSTNELKPSITVDTGLIVRPVPDLLFGTNVEWIYNGNGLWDESQKALNVDVIRSARQAGITNVRFPGGVFADYYDWRDGVGPASSRPRRQHSPSDKNISHHVIGTHEIAGFARQIGAELVLQVNIITGTPEEAAAWVAYCNSPTHPERARNGSPPPFNVRYWEIGNESYIRGDSEATRKAYLTPRQYADRFLRFAQAMKQADSSIKLIAIGGRNFGKYGFVTDQSWNSTVLSRAGSAIDYFAVHNAYAPVAAGQSRLSTEDVYRAMFAFPLQVERNLQDLDREIESRTSAGDSHRVRIAVTEWGPYFHVIPQDRFLDHVKTLGSAIYAADILATFLRTSRTGLANFFKLTDVAWLGWTGPDGVPKPSLLALQMFRRHFGTNLIHTEVAAPVFSAPEAGMVAAEDGVPLVSAVSSLSADGKTLYIIAINKDIASPIDLDLNIMTGRPSGSISVHTLSGPAIDANNGHKLPSIPGLRWANPARASRNSKFDQGAPGTVEIRASKLVTQSATIGVRLDPVSVTSFEIPLR